jgi:TrmH family RNA methyltransferase
VLTKNQEKLIRSLSVRKNRKKTGLFVAEGMKLVTDFLNSGLVAENIFVVDVPMLNEITGPSRVD